MINYKPIKLIIDHLKPKYSSTICNKSVPMGTPGGHISLRSHARALPHHTQNPDVTMHSLIIFGLDTPNNP